MTEPVDALQMHRFIIDEPSLTVMKRLRGLQPELNKAYRVVQGLSFFGSRTKATNQPDSDLDLCVFYDGSAFGHEIRTEEDVVEAALSIDKATGELFLDNHQADLAVSRTKDRKQFEAKVREKYRDILVAELNLPPEKLEGQIKSVITIDISQEATDRSLEQFYLTADVIRILPFNDNNKVDLIFFRLLSRFFLGVGKELYRSRKYILESLERRRDGEYLFQILLQKLDEFEKYKSRNSTSFTGYPKTINEGKNYFLTE